MSSNSNRGNNLDPPTAASSNARGRLTRRAALGVAAASGVVLLDDRGKAARLPIEVDDDAFILLRRPSEVPDGDCTSIVKAAMRLAIQTGKPIELSGAMKVSGDIKVSGGFAIRGTGIIDLSPGGSITIGTGVTALPDLAANIELFGTTLRFKSAHGLAAADVVAAWNPAEFSFAPFRRYYRAGDMYRVAQVLDAFTVRIFGVAQERYEAADLKMYRLNGGSFRAEGIRIVPPPSGIPLFLDGLVDVLLHGLQIASGANDTAIEVHRCFNVGISDPTSTVLHGDAYPITISNSQKITVTATRGLYSKRHCLALGGRDGVASVPTADVLVSGMIGDNLAENAVGAADIHGNCKRVVYDNCLLSMASIGGRDVALRNCRITGRPPDPRASGNVIWGSEIAGGTYTIENCHLLSIGDGIRDACFLDLDLPRRITNFTLIMRNNTFEHSGEPPARGYLLKFYVGETEPAPHRIDIVIDGLHYMGDGPVGTIIGITGQADISAIASIDMRSFTGKHIAPLACSNRANYDIALRGYRDELCGVTSFGDLSVTLSADRVSPAGALSTKVNIWDLPLTAPRTVTIDSVRARQGDGFRIVRQITAVGSFPLTIDAHPPKSLAAGQWSDVAFDGRNWTVVAWGLL